jgi:hypothetical protein
MVATPRMERPFELREGSHPQLWSTFEYLGPPPRVSFQGALTRLLPLFLIVILNEAFRTESPLDHVFSVLILTWQGLLDGVGFVEPDGLDGDADGGGLGDGFGPGVSGSGFVDGVDGVDGIDGTQVESPPAAQGSRPIVRR